MRVPTIAVLTDTHTTNKPRVRTARKPTDLNGSSFFAQIGDTLNCTEKCWTPVRCPDHPDRAEYQRMIGIRRGNTDDWLRARALAERGRQ